MNATEVLKRYAAGGRNFRNANLRGQSFKGQNLSAADFSGADLRGTNFLGATLEKTQFERARIQGSNFKKTNLRHANFRHAKAGYELDKVAILILVMAVFSILINQKILNTIITFFVVFIICIVGRLFFIFEPLTNSYKENGLIFKDDNSSNFVKANHLKAVCKLKDFSSNIWMNNLFKNSYFFIPPVICAALNTTLFLTIKRIIFSLSLIEHDFFYSLGVWTLLRNPLFPILTSITLAGIGLMIQDTDAPSPEAWFYPIAPIFTQPTKFTGSDLSHVSFIYADINNVDFRGARFYRTFLLHSKGFETSLLTLSYPSKAIYLMATGKGRQAIFDRHDWSEMVLAGADLREAQFVQTDLRNSNLQDVDLSGAQLVRTQLGGTDLANACFTGACIEDWNINSATNLDGVVCDYVYLKRDRQARRPVDPRQNFAPGEFTQLFQKVANVVELIFHHGLDWEAFAVAFDATNLRLRSSTGGELNLREYKVLGDGLVSLTVETPPDADKEKIQAELSEERIARLRLEGELKGLKEAHALLLRVFTPHNIYIQGDVGSVGNQGTQNNVAGDVAGNQTDNQDRV